MVAGSGEEFSVLGMSFAMAVLVTPKERKKVLTMMQDLKMMWKGGNGAGNGAGDGAGDAVVVTMATVMMVLSWGDAPIPPRWSYPLD